MDFKLGEVSKEQGKSFDLFTGAIKYEVIAVNPTVKELEEAGITWMKQEPDYIKDFGGDEFISMEFWMKATDEEVNNQIVPLKFLLSFADYTTQAGKNKYIDITGRTSWDNEPGDWFIGTESRLMKKGEEEFYRFINRWLNMNKKGESSSCRFDIDKMMTGDFSELKNVYTGIVLPKQAETGMPYTIFGLTGVSSRESNGKQYNNLAIYNKQFYAGSYSPNFASSSFKDYVEKSGHNSFGTDNKPIAYSFDIEKFDPSKVASDEDKPASNVDMGSFGQQIAEAPKADDLPF